MPRLSCCLYLALMVPLPVRAQDLASFTGFTRPGAPNDTREDGKVRYAADDPNLNKTAIGATVYFTVLDLTAKADWGVDLEALTSRFKTGIDATGGSSPVFDGKARYLYLYQVVNDRGTDLPVQNTLLRLPDDIKGADITSWGAFRGIGLKLAKPVEGKQSGPILPVSATHRDGTGPGELLYRSLSPATPAAQLYRLGLLYTKGDPAPKPGPGVARIDWEAIDPAYQPDHVILAARREAGGLAFRAVFSDKEGLPRKGRSTVYGFTSKLPPRFETVRIQGPRDPAAPVRPADLGGDEDKGGDGKVIGEGQAPVPRPERKAERKPEPEPPEPEQPVSFPPLPISTPAAGSVSSPGGGSSPGSVLGGATASSGGGGSAAGGSGSGQQQQRQQQQQQLTPLQRISLIVRQTITQTQQQNQSQSQDQSQNQSQQQNQVQTPGTPTLEPVPEPPTFFAGVLALTFLCLPLVRGRNRLAVR